MVTLVGISHLYVVWIPWMYSKPASTEESVLRVRDDVVRDEGAIPLMRAYGVLPQYAVMAMVSNR